MILNQYQIYDQFLKDTNIDRLQKILSRYELFKKIINVPGDICECGVFKGTGIFTWIKLLKIFKPNNSFKVIGFDFFKNKNRPKLKYKLEENGDPNWWIGIRENIVRKVLEERFNKKNKDFIDILKATYPSQLIYEQPLRNKSIEGDYLEDIYGKFLMEIREKLINEGKEKKNKSGGSNIKLKRDSVKKRTSIGNSVRSRPKNKYKKRTWKKYRGQGK